MLYKLLKKLVITSFLRKIIPLKQWPCKSAFFLVSLTVNATGTRHDELVIEYNCYIDPFRHAILFLVFVVGMLKRKHSS